MTQFTRRQILVGTAAAAVTAAIPFAVPSPVGAVAPAVGRQASGFYRFKVGSIEVTVVTDGINRMPISDGFVLNARNDEINSENGRCTMCGSKISGVRSQYDRRAVYPR